MLMFLLQSCSLSLISKSSCQKLNLNADRKHWTGYSHMFKLKREWIRQTHLSEFSSWFSFVSTAFRAASKQVLVWSSLCWATTAPLEDSGTWSGPSTHTWVLTVFREGLCGAGTGAGAGAGAGFRGPWAGEDGELKATLWITLTVTHGETGGESPAAEETTAGQIKQERNSQV